MLWVNQRLVTKYLANENPIGRMVKLNVLETIPSEPVRDATFEIIGVVADAKNSGPREPPLPSVRGCTPEHETPWSLEAGDRNLGRASRRWSTLRLT